MASSVQRKLTAILMADVKGYSRLMGADEEATLRQLREYQEITRRLIEEHHGHLVDAPGDALLADFGSVVDAVRCAVEVQRELGQRNTELPADRRMDLRMGINLGDVIVDGDSLYGDGVNIAARLEPLAEAGGICISGTVYDSIHNKMDLTWEYLGEQTLKNISQPIRAYRFSFVEQKLGQDALQPPDKPSIAVLPFNNLSGDPEQEYFSDGVTEDIITALSRIRWFFVIARNSTFTYKGTSPDVRQIARELGVRYVLEGSIRKAAHRVRISAQIIDGTTGSHVWAERYDRELKDMFEVQDEITQTVVGTIEPEVAKAERERAKAKRPHNLDAWDRYQLGMYHVHKRTREDLDEAYSLFAKVVESNPTFGAAFSGLAYCHHLLFHLGLTDSPEEHRQKALVAARRAIELDEEDALARTVLGIVHLGRHEPDEAMLELQAAVDLNPNSAFAHLYLGSVLLQGFGEATTALIHYELAIRLSPRDVFLGPTIGRIGHAHFYLGDYEKAVEYLRRALRYPMTSIRSSAFLVSALTHLGRREEAQHAYEELLRRRPDFTCSLLKGILPSHIPDFVDRIIEGLHKAGVPE